MKIGNACTPRPRAVLAGFAVFALLTGALPASAMMIVGGITFSGDFVPVPGIDLVTASGIDFLGDNFDVDDANGDFAAAGLSQGDAGSIGDFQFAPFAGPIALWTIDGFTFVLESVMIVAQNSDFLALLGTGVVQAAGFDDTQASLALTANRAGGLYNFSAGISNVPVPAAVWLFASALLSLGFRRKVAGNI